MKERTRNLQMRWIRLVGWLVLVASLVVTPMTPMIHVAAQAQPQQFGPSSYLPQMRKNYCSGTRPADNPIGVQIYGRTGYTEPNFELLQQSQTPWVRNILYWYDVEPENVPTSEYRWRSTDLALRTAKVNCTNMVGVILGSPLWAAPDSDLVIKPEMMPEFVEFVRAIVERYDGDGRDDTAGNIVVNYWEFFNEPDNIRGDDGWGLHGDRYAEMLRAIYQVVHKANSNAKVVFGGIAYDAFTDDAVGNIFERDFLDTVLEAGGGDYFDIMNFHYYPFQTNRIHWTKTDSSGLIEKAANIQDILEAHGVTGKGLMITEIGWHSNSTDRYPSTPEFQSRNVVQLLTQAVALDAIAIIWWALYDPDPSYIYKSGLATNGNVTKPAYAVYREAMRRIGTSSSVDVIRAATDTNDLEVYESREPGTNKVQYIAWLNPVVPFSAAALATFDDTTTETWLAPNASRVTIYSKEGTQLRTIEDAADGSADKVVTVTVGRDPIYIVVD